MKRNQLVRTVGFFLMCATICQSVQAASPRTRTYKATRVAGAKVHPRQGYDNYGVSRGESPMSNRTRTWLNEDQSVLSPVPMKGMLIITGGMMGEGGIMKGNYDLGASGKTELDMRSESFGAAIGARYGITEALSVSASITHMPGKTDVDAQNGNQKYTTPNKNEGRREPEIGVAFSGKVNPGTRITGELVAAIPVGQARESSKNGESTRNGLTGGGNFGPRVTVVTSTGGIKLIGNLGYRFQQETKTEDERATSTRTYTGSGGNTTNALAAIELPRIANLGFGALYNAVESANKKSETSQYSSDGYRLVGLTAYAGIPVSGSNFVLMPRATYQTMLNREQSGINVDRADLFSVGLQGLMHF